MHGGPKWMRPAQSNTCKNDRYKRQQSRRPAPSLLAEPTVTCFPANVWNWLQAAGKPAILLQCSYVFAQKLLQQLHMHTQDLTALFTKSHTLNWRFMCMHINCILHNCILSFI